MGIETILQNFVTVAVALSAGGEKCNRRKSAQNPPLKYTPLDPCEKP